MLRHPLPGLIQPLGLVHDSRFKVATLVVLCLKLGDVLVCEGLVVKSDGVVVGLTFCYDLIKDITFLGVYGQVVLVFFL